MQVKHKQKFENKKVLIIGPLFHGYNKSIADAFLEHGCQVEVYSYHEDYEPLFINKFKIGLTRKLGFERFYFEENKKINNAIKALFDDFSPDLVLIVKGHRVTRETLEHFKKRESIVCLWMLDSVFRFKSTYETIDLYDELFMFEKTDVNELAKKGIDSHFLPIGYDSNVYFNRDNPDKNIDIFFVGNLYGNRKVIINKLIEDFPDKKIVVYGKYITRYKDYIDFIFNKRYRNFKNTTITPAEINKFYSKAKIAINIHHEQSKHGVNPRFYEIAGTNTFQLIDSNDFLEGKYHDIVTFRDYQELYEKIIRYLEDQNARRASAEALYTKVTNNDSFYNRIELMLEKIQKVANRV